MAETSQFVIQYIADTNKFKNSLKQLNRINKETARKFGSDFVKATQIVSTQIDKINSKKVTINGKSAVQNIAQISTVFKDANGKLKTFTQQAELTKNGLKTLNTTIKDGGKVTRTFGDNMKTLGKRALVTIPIWFALRTAIFGTIRGISDGISSIIEFDRALQKLRKNLQGTAGEVESNFNRAKEVITDFAIESGRSTEEITKAIQQFATVGFDFETALEAGLGATKLAVVLFGEGEQTAKAFSRAMKVLVDRSDQLRSPGQQINEIFALTSELWETNAFEIGELSQGLEKFAGTAKALNLTAEETVTLLGALSSTGLNANRGGTLLRTTFQKLEGNLQEVAKTLGIRVNPEVDRTFDVFRKVTNAIAELRSEAGTISPAVSEAIRNIFGGVRGGEPILDIIADIEQVNATLDEFTQRRADVDAFNKSFEDVTDTLFIQSERFKTLRVELGKAFAEGLTNSDSFEKTVKRTNDVLEQLLVTSKDLGQAFGLLFGGIINTLPVELGIRVLENQENANDQASAIFDRIQVALNKQSTPLEIQELITEIVDLNLVKKGKISGRTLGVLTKLIAEDIEEEIEKTEIDVDPKINISGDNVSFKEQQDISEAIVRNEIDRLRLQGATASELLKAESSLNKQFGIVEQELDILQRQLDTEKAINEERRLRNTLSSETVKLFRIAQESGTDVARQIGDVLSGNVDFTNFVRRGGEALEVFKQQFSGLFEQQQALSFFRGETIPGVQGLRGGTRISIAEEQVRRGIPSFSAGAQLARQRAVSGVPQIRQDIQASVRVSADISGLSIEEAKRELSTQISNEIIKPESELSKAIDEKLNRF